MLDYLCLRLGVMLAGASGLARLKREEGQTLVEYALICVTIAIAVTGAMLFLSEEVDAMFRRVGSAFQP